MIRQGWLRVLTALELALLLALGEYMNKDSGETWVSTGKVGDLMGKAPSTVYDALARLRKRGLLRSEIREREGRWRKYAVHVHTLIPMNEIPAVSSVERYAPETPEDEPQEDAPGNQEDTFPAVMPGEPGESPGIQDRTFTPENGETPHQDYVPDTLSDKKYGDYKADQITALHAGGNGAQEPALVRLEQILDSLRESPSEVVIRSLITAGRHSGWTEADVRRHVDARWPEVVRN